MYRLFVSGCDTEIVLLAITSLSMLLGNVSFIFDPIFERLSLLLPFSSSPLLSIVEEVVVEDSTLSKIGGEEEEDVAVEEETSLVEGVAFDSNGLDDDSAAASASTSADIVSREGRIVNLDAGLGYRTRNASHAGSCSLPAIKESVSCLSKPRSR
jgi:hypothetical protein